MLGKAELIHHPLDADDKSLGWKWVELLGRPALSPTMAHLNHQGPNSRLEWVTLQTSNCDIIQGTYLSLMLTY